MSLSQAALSTGTPAVKLPSPAPHLGKNLTTPRVHRYRWLLEVSPSTQGKDLSNSHYIFPHLQSLIPARFPYSGYITGLATHL